MAHLAGRTVLMFATLLAARQSGFGADPSLSGMYSGIWEGNVKVKNRLVSIIRLEITQTNDQVVGREFIAGPDATPLAMVAMVGAANGKGFLMQEKQVLQTRVKYDCLSTAQFLPTSNPDVITGKDKPVKGCPESEWLLKRNPIKTQQWAVCSVLPAAKIMEALAGEDMQSTQGRAQQSATNTNIQLGRLLSVNVVDAIFATGTFTCSANFQQSAQTANDRASSNPNSDVSWDLAEKLLPSLITGTPANRMFEFRRIDDKHYQVTLHSQRSDPYRYSRTFELP